MARAQPQIQETVRPKGGSAARFFTRGAGETDSDEAGGTSKSNTYMPSRRNRDKRQPRLGR